MSQAKESVFEASTKRLSISSMIALPSGEARSRSCCSKLFDFYSLDILPTLRPGALNWAQHSIDVVTPEIWVRIGEWPIVRDQPCLVFRGIDPGLQRADVKPNRHLRSPTCKSSAGPMPHLKYRLPSHPSSDAANQGRSIPVQHGSAYELGKTISAVLISKRRHPVSSATVPKRSLSQSACDIYPRPCEIFGRLLHKTGIAKTARRHTMAFAARTECSGGSRPYRRGVPE